MTNESTFSFFTKLTGQSFRPNANEIIKKLISVGDVLNLQAEPDNQYDQNAVAVYFREDQIGYLKKDLAAKIQKDVIKGNVTCTVSEVTGRDKDNVGCNIELEVVRVEDKDYQEAMSCATEVFDCGDR